MIIDRTSWGRLKVTGGDRTRFLQGMTTINVDKLEIGNHAWGAILSPKGRVLSVIDLARPDAATYIVACEPALVAKTATLLDRYAVMDDVVFEPLLAGPAHQVWDAAADVWTAPIVEGPGVGAVADTDPAAERLRILAGFPRYGIDVGEDHFPFETPIAAFLDYKKGCYVGQEPVFRVYAQGQAAKQQRSLAIEGTAPIEAGAAVAHAAKSNAGTVTSSIVDGDRTLAIAYIARAAWEPGGRVTVDGRAGTVHELPWIG